MRGADILVEMLIGYGVDTIFGVPGDTNVPFYEALQLRADEIRHVMARDERSAGFMADAYGRFTNRPGVFECPSGAGAMYSLPPVAPVRRYAGHPNTRWKTWFTSTKASSPKKFFML